MPITSSAEKSNIGRIRVYRPDSRFSCGPIEAINALLGEMIAFRSHIKMLFLSQFQQAYQGTALGVFWNFILPVIPITVYILLVNLRVLPEYDGMSPAVYIGFNVTLWHVLTGFLRQPIQIVKSRNATIMQTAMPLSAAIASSFAQLCFDTLVRLGFVICMVIVMRDWPAPIAPLALAAILCGLIFFLGLGLALAILNAIYPDIERVVTIILQYGIFLSGVIFPISTMPKLSFLEFANPFNVFIHATRDIAFFGTLSHPVAFAGWALAGFAILFVSMRFFYVMEYRLRGLS